LLGRVRRPDRRAPAGFLNLLAPSSAPSLPALFHAGSALGVCPSEPRSSRAAVRCFQRLSPLGVRFAFRVLLRARVRHSSQWFRLSSSASLSWAFFPPGFSPSLRWNGLHRSSPPVVACSDTKRLSTLHFRVSFAERLAGLSRDCRPSWNFWPPDSSPLFERQRIRESPPQ